MSNNLYVKPFTQIVEDVMYEMREANFADPYIEKKYQRRVNDVYQRLIPAEFEFWDFLKKRGTVTLATTLTTGTLSCTQGSTTITYSEGGLTPDAYIGYKLTVPGANEVYDITDNDATTFTISSAYVGTTAGTVNFRVYKSTYSLPRDFEYLLVEPGFWYEYGQSRHGLSWEDDKDWASKYSTVPQQFPISIREYTELSSDGLNQIEVMPPVTAARIVHFEYIKSLPEMREFTTGTASTTLGSTSVTLSSDFSSYVSAGQYFRVDADGTWKRIVSVSGATLTLESGYSSTQTTKAYTVSDAPIIPHYLQMAIFFGACMLTGQEQGSNADTQAFAAEYKMIIAKAVTKQAKKRYGHQVLRFSQHRARRYNP